MCRKGSSNRVPLQCNEAAGKALAQRHMPVDICRPREIIIRSLSLLLSHRANKSLSWVIMDLFRVACPAINSACRLSFAWTSSHPRADEMMTRSRIRSSSIRSSFRVTVEYFSIPKRRDRWVKHCQPDLKNKSKKVKLLCVMCMMERTKTVAVDRNHAFCLGNHNITSLTQIRE